MRTQIWKVNGTENLLKRERLARQKVDLKTKNLTAISPKLKPLSISFCRTLHILSHKPLFPPSLHLTSSQPSMASISSNYVKADSSSWNPSRKIRIVGKIRGFTDLESQSSTGFSGPWISVGKPNGEFSESVTLSFGDHPTRYSTFVF